VNRLLDGRRRTTSTVAPCKRTDGKRTDRKRTDRKRTDRKRTGQLSFATSVFLH
jgi:hypothetical protein